jgi:gamma-glutamyltranspeptidase/glutathione hydrolase
VVAVSLDIGSDLFALVWDGTTLHGLNASGRAPAALTRDAVLEHAARTPSPAVGGEQRHGELFMPSRGWLPVTVPGAPGGWRDLHAKFGALPFDELFVDAVSFADNGFPVSPTIAGHWQRSVTTTHADLDGPEFAEWARVFAPGGRAPRAGERWRNPDAARTLRLIAGSHAEAFYQGEIADALATHAARTGGLLTADDLAAHSSTWVEPIVTGYHGHEVWQLPPNGQGLAALLALGILDGTEPTDDAGLAVHRQVEAMKLGFADTHAWVADPDFAPAPLDALLDPAYLAHRRALIGPRAQAPTAGDPLRGGTVYLCTADADGMMVSLIQSNYMGFGSHVVVPGTGFTLQNRGAGFVLDEAHPNVLAPRKRPFHTIIPGFLTRAGLPVGPFGVMGGHMQPQGHLQLVVSTVDDNLDPQAALDRPRWYWHHGLDLAVEPDFGTDRITDLRRRGHHVTVVDEPAGFGYGQAIWHLPDGAGYTAATEPRADGAAYGY